MHGCRSVDGDTRSTRIKIATHAIADDFNACIRSGIAGTQLAIDVAPPTAHCPIVLDGTGMIDATGHPYCGVLQPTGARKRSKGIRGRGIP